MTFVPQSCLGHHLIKQTFWPSGPGPDATSYLPTSSNLLEVPLFRTPFFSITWIIGALTTCLRGTVTSRLVHCQTGIFFKCAPLGHAHKDSLRGLICTEHARHWDYYGEQFNTAPALRLPTIEETDSQNNRKNTDVIATVIIHIERYMRP